VLWRVLIVMMPVCCVTANTSGNMGQHCHVVCLPGCLCTCLANCWSCAGDGWNGQ